MEKPTDSGAPYICGLWFGATELISFLKMWSCRSHKHSEQD